MVDSLLQKKLLRLYTNWYGESIYIATKFFILKVKKNVRKDISIN